MGDEDEIGVCAGQAAWAAVNAATAAAPYEVIDAVGGLSMSGRSRGRDGLRPG